MRTFSFRYTIIRLYNGWMRPLAWLLLLLIGSTAAQNPQEKKTIPQNHATIFANGKILVGQAQPLAQALAIQDGRIVALGTIEDVRKKAGPNASEVDLHGATLMPSFKDHHLHVLNIGYNLLNQQMHGALMLDLSGARSEKEVGDLVAARAKQMKPGAWIVGNGWSQGAWGQTEMPGRKTLDEASPENPVFLVRVDGHAGWVNSAALKIARIGSDTPEPAGGKILRDKDGNPTGMLLERANEAIVPYLPEPTDEQIAEAFRLATQKLASLGITDVYDAGFLRFPGIVAMNADLRRPLNLLLELDRSEPLPISMNLMVPGPSALAEMVLRGRTELPSSANVHITHLKLFVDGALGSRGAALLTPYSDEPDTSGVFRMREAEIRYAAVRALESGLDVATHAIGDGAVHRVLDAYEAILKTRRLEPRRLRIEHFSVSTAEDIQRAAESGILLVVQPGFIYPDEKGVTMEDLRLGKERARGAYAFATLEKSGAALAGSSDDFGLPSSPFASIYAAVTRASPEGHPQEGWHPAEKLSREDAIRQFTLFYPPGGGPPTGNALRIGGPATFIIVGDDPLEVSPAQLPAIRVHATLRDGKVIYSDGDVRF